MASEHGPVPPEVLAAYLDGRMPPEVAQRLEADAAAGLWDALPPRRASAPAAAAPMPAPSPEAPSSEMLGMEFAPSPGTGPSGAPAIPVPPPAAAPQPPTPVAGAPLPRPEAPAPRPPEDVAAEELPDWMWMPEAWTNALGTMTAGAAEAAQIIKKSNPAITVEEKNGYYTFKYPTGEKYALKPGARPSDVMRLLVTMGGTAAATSFMSALAPALVPASVAARVAQGTAWAPRAAKVLGWGATGAAEALGQELGQGMVGGDVNPEAVKIGALFGAGVPLAATGVKKALQGAGSRLYGAVADTFAPPSTPVPREYAKDLGETIANAGVGLPGAVEDVRASMKVRPDVMGAAQQFGVDVPLGVASDSDAVRQVMANAAAPSRGTRTAAENTRMVEAMKAKNLEVVRGPGPALNDTSEAIRVKGLADVERLRVEARDIHNEAYKKIPATEPAPVPGLLKFIKEEEDKLVTVAAKKAGESGAKQVASPLIRKLKKALTPRKIVSKDPLDPPGTVLGKSVPTFHRVLQLSRLVGAATKGRGKFKDDPNLWIASRALKELKAVLNPIAQKFGADELLEKGKAKVKERFAKQKGLVKLFGAEVENSLHTNAVRAMSEIAGGSEKPLINLLSRVPKDQHEALIRGAFAEMIEKQPLEAFNSVWERAQKNKTIRAAFESNLPKGTAAMWDSLYTLSKAFERNQNAIGVVDSALKTSTPPGKGVLDAMLGVLKVGTVALPWRIAGMARMGIAALKNPKDPALHAALDWLDAPGTREFLLGLKPGVPVPPGRIEAFVNSPAFKRLGTFVPEVVDKVAWVKRLVEDNTRLPRRTGGQWGMSAVQGIRGQNEGREDTR